MTTTKPADRRSVPARPRNPARVAIAVLLVVGSGLLSLQLYRSAGERKPYLVVVHDVPVGQRLTDADVREAEIATDVGLAAVPASDRPAVVGQVVRTPLAAGQVLTRDAVVADAVVPAGKAVVSIPVPEGQVPSGVRSGDRIWLVLRSSDDPGAVAGAVDATFYDLATSEAGGGVIVTALVDIGRVTSVTTAAAAQRVSVAWVDPSAPAPPELPSEVVVG